MKINKGVAVGLTIIAIALICVAFRIYSINKKFPAMNVTTIPFGETTSVLGAEVTINSFKIGRPEEFSLVPQYENEYDLIVEMILYNPEDEALTLPLSDFYLESGAWSNGLVMDYYGILNPNFRGFTILLEPKKEATILLPYLLIDSQVRQFSDDAVKEREYKLVRIKYPNKEVFELS